MPMEKNIDVEATIEADDQDRPISAAAGKFALATIGAVGLAQDTLESWLHRAIERGELTQVHAQQTVSEMRKKRPHLRRSLKADMDSTLETADLPSKSDIQALHDQIAALSAKVDRINQEKAGTTAPIPAPVITPKPLPKA